MIITRTPFRMSFVGGGSDLEDFYSRHEGAVLSVSINKYMYISSHFFFEGDKIRVKYSRTETVAGAQEIHHPIVREVLKKFNVSGGVEISSNGDVPSGTGLGSSSAFTVGLLHNMYVREGRYVTKENLAEDACDIEINRLGEPIGKQDQYAVALGGLNILRFHSSGQVTSESVHLKRDIYKALQARLLLFYTGEQRKTSQILGEQRDNIRSSSDRFEVLKEMVSFVEPMRRALCDGNLPDIGRILHKSWLLKQKLASRINTPELDALYARALQNGASGGKILGAGGGGFFLFYCEPEHQDRLRAAMSPLQEMSFKFDNEGSKIIYVGDEYLRR